MVNNYLTKHRENLRQINLSSDIRSITKLEIGIAKEYSLILVAIVMGKSGIEEVAKQNLRFAGNERHYARVQTIVEKISRKIINHKNLYIAKRHQCHRRSKLYSISNLYLEVELDTGKV